jgi:hypothetical protein
MFVSRAVTRLKPFGADERREQIDQQQARDGGGQKDHGSRLSDFFAGGNEPQTYANADQPQNEGRRQPETQVHSVLLKSATPPRRCLSVVGVDRIRTADAGLEK